VYVGVDTYSIVGFYTNLRDYMILQEVLAGTCGNTLGCSTQQDEELGLETLNFPSAGTVLVLFE
jgi:hypothetical protein